MLLTQIEPSKWGDFTATSREHTFRYIATQAHALEGNKRTLEEAPSLPLLSITLWLMFYWLERCQAITLFCFESEQKQWIFEREQQFWVQEIPDLRTNMKYCFKTENVCSRIAIVFNVLIDCKFVFIDFLLVYYNLIALVLCILNFVKQWNFSIFKFTLFSHYTYIVSIAKNK